MSYILVDFTWTGTGNGGGGNVDTGRGIAFNTDTKQIEDYAESRNAAILDPIPPDVHLPPGTVIYWECDENYTATKYIYDGGRATHVEREPQSGTYCGWTPPLTCDLGTASVTQQLTAGGTATLTFAFTGTVNGQAAYSLDGGAEQTSPTFLSVPAGPHTLKLRDNGLAGCERVVEVEVLAAVPPPLPPPAPTGPSQGVDFVGQPLWYALADQPIGALVELELWAERGHGQDDFARVLLLRKRVDAQGQVSFRLDTLLWPLLSAFVPLPAAATSVCTTNLLNYYVRTTLTPLDTRRPAVATVSPLRTALRGGLPAEWQDVDYFSFRLGSTFPAVPFLSWQPQGPGAYAAGQAKPIVLGQPEWLFFLCPLGLTDAQLQVRRATFVSEGSAPLIDFEPLARPAGRGWAQRLLAIPLRATRTGAARVSVRLETTAGAVVSAEAFYRFVEASPRTRFLLLTNSLGGVDTLRCEGRLEGTLDAAADQVELPARAGQPAPAADRQLSDLTASRKLKLATGWLAPAELAWAQEVVLSRELWQQVGAQLLPLSAGKRTLALPADEPALRGLLLEFDYAFAPTAYAPPRA